jgi:hypothetical protein
MTGGARVGKVTLMNRTISPFASNPPRNFMQLIATRMRLITDHRMLKRVGHGYDPRPTTKEAECW